MARRTTVYLDEAVLNQAKSALGTSGVSDTIHRALEEVAYRDAVTRLLDYDLPGLTSENLRRLREEEIPLGGEDE